MSGQVYLDSLSTERQMGKKHQRRGLASVHPIQLNEPMARRLNPRNHKFSANPNSCHWSKNLERIDIHRNIPFSWIRCVLSLVSLLLLASDIPRSGLGVKAITGFYSKHSAPDTVTFFSPEPYPVAHISCSQDYTSKQSDFNRSNCSASDGRSTILEIPSWYYGFDSTSIALRGFVELYDVPRFPDFLLERGSDSRIRDPYATINSYSTFRMLDSLFEAAIEVTNTSQQTNSTSTLWFASRYRWIDRLHHYVLPFNVQNYRWRLNALYLRSFGPVNMATSEDSEIQICRLPSKRRSVIQLYPFCDHFINWKCASPYDQSLGKISVRNHMTIRLRNLRQQYPNLTVDTLVFVSEEMSATSSVLSRAIMDNLEVAEIVVLTRGRSCSENRCITTFVDDFRYERRIITTTAIEWYGVTAGLRGAAQVYVWTRLGCLFYVAYLVQPVNCKSMRHRLGLTLLSIVKIPFHTVVYGSLIPIMLYVAAYFVDAWFIEYKLDSMWTTIKDNYSKVNQFEFIRMCTMQMRNVWFLALIAKIPVILQTRDSRWRPHMGIRGVRGLAIGVASMISIFGPFRSLRFRSSKIVSLVEFGGIHPGATFTALRIEPGLPTNMLLLPIGWSQVMTALAILVMLAVEFVSTLISWKYGNGCWNYELLFGHSILVPHSAGTLWPITALAVRFHVSNVIGIDSRHPHSGLTWNFMRSRSQIYPYRHSDSCTEQSSPTTPERLELTRFRWRHSVSISDRSGGTRAVVQLMNICMMSDPWTLFRLRTIGVELHVYRIRNGDTETYSAILPYRPNDMREWTGLQSRQFECIAVVNSSELPLWMLVQCG